VKGSAVGGVVISDTVWPASVRAATVVVMARSMAGVGGTTPGQVRFAFQYIECGWDVPSELIRPIRRGLL
jgi:hypothetical protein